MTLQTYTIECHDVNGIVFKRVTIKGANETDGLNEAKAWGRGEACAFFTVRARRGVIFNSRSDV